MRLGIFCVAGLALLGGCDDKTGGSRNDEAKRPGPAEGKAEEGKIALKAPGFDLSINIPRQIAARAKSDQDSELLYPGSSINGMYIAAGNGGEGKGEGKGEVELRFAAPATPGKVEAWYRDPARAGNFAIDEVRRSGAELLIGGHSKGDGETFKLRLQGDSGGGTEGRLVLRDAG
jgi:hypothetical protein